ncbi:hypothetical protein EV176_005415 [Coemansia sp. RSA 451]|nr:hypothetical protein LPJ67_003883 [Coemansia sp. RSA 1938]KAJ2266975.1 hypothetical protein EV176_005415 [Coemansia sp. RSA 451]KAJ2446636.1 hypothetical protein IWW46_000799 [Coemansia sp. RSA 2440]KAJ2726486.1 hypothetical protein H4S00_001850 [Coemansia sp. D1744]
MIRTVVAIADVTDFIIAMLPFIYATILNVYYAIGNAFAIIETRYMLFTFDPATAELAEANDELHSASDATVEKTKAMITAAYNFDEPDIKVKEATATNDELCTASDALTEKTEITRTVMYNYTEPGAKAKNATAANDELYMASNAIVEKPEAVVTADNSAKEHEFEAKKATEAQKHNVHSRKVGHPLAPKRKSIIHIRGGMYGNINNVLQRYDGTAGYYSKITYNPDGGHKRRGELVPNYYGFAAF